MHHRSHILEPLIRISSSKNKFLKGWKTEQDQALSQLKSLMARQVLLHYPDVLKPFDIYTDASAYQLGGVITQNDFPIAFYSNSAQRNCTTMEKELLSIVETATHHRGILLGFKICFHSDHKNLSFENFKSERVRRWRLLLEEFNYEFKYTPGKDNVVADMISRDPTINVDQHSIEELATIDELNDFPLNFTTIAKHQSNDKQLQKNLHNNPSLYEIKFVNGTKLIFHKNKVFLPASLLQPIVTWYHEILNHPDILRTLNRINMHFLPIVSNRSFSSTSHLVLPA